MEWLIVFAVFAAAAYIVYGKRKSKGGSYRAPGDKKQER